MSSPRGVVYRILDADHTEDKAALGFFDALLEIDEELSDIEYNISNVPLDLTGYHAQKELAEYEKEYVMLKEEIKEAQQAVIYGQPANLDRFDTDFLPSQKSKFLEYESRYNNQIKLLEEHAYRVGEQLEGKRSSANARMSATISVGAVIISTLTLLLNTLGIV